MEFVVGCSMVMVMLACLFLVCFCFDSVFLSLLYFFGRSMGL